MKMKKNYGYARLMEILTPSRDRVEPKCAFHKQCGGCQIQALSYEKQLEYKKKKVLNNLTRIGGLTELPEFDVIGMDEPYHYRNKAQFPFGTDKNGEVVTGFYAGRTHSIISNTNCYLGVEENEQILEIILAHLKKYNIPAYDEQTGKGVLRHVLIRKGFTTGELMVCLILNGKKLAGQNELAAKLAEIFEGTTYEQIGGLTLDALLYNKLDKAYEEQLYLKQHWARKERATSAYEAAMIVEK